jgi:hypothetical protein
MDEFVSLLKSEVGLYLGIITMFVGCTSLFILVGKLAPKLEKENKAESARLFRKLGWFDGMLFIGMGVAMLAVHMKKP